jgi:hypothetical protein
METFVLIKTGLVFHLVGIVLMAGFTAASLVTFRKAATLMNGQEEKAIFLLTGISSYAKLQMAGALLLLAGGVIMMIGYHGTVMQMLWFKIKLIALGLIILNQVVAGRRAGNSLKHFLGTYEKLQIINKPGFTYAGKRLRIFYGGQLIFILAIFILSAFRFT